jgi:hypothetical protein
MLGEPMLLASGVQSDGWLMLSGGENRQVAETECCTKRSYKVRGMLTGQWHTDTNALF